mmetsp:Transcript_3902/g.7272  ORF Transcript_3902/g.7272 Transcript_3902/m.7272 type:complete len:180 (+) Transcript_3902:143-682(+)
MSGTTIPLASVRRCVDHANPGAVFSKAAYEGLLICCEEFITMVTSEASNTRPNTLKIDHLQLALKGLDFEALCSHLPEQEQDGESCFHQSNESESDAEASTGVSSSNKKKKKQPNKSSVSPSAKLDEKTTSNENVVCAAKRKKRRKRLTREEEAELIAEQERLFSESRLRILQQQNNNV